MFDKFMPKDEQPTKEESMQRTQINADQQREILGQVTSPQADMALLEHQKEREDLVKWQQDLKKELENLEHDLKREIQDEKGDWVPMTEPAVDQDTGEYIVDKEKEEMMFVPVAPACNQLCIQMIKTNCRPLMSRNMMMSNFQEERILQMLKRTMAAIIRNIGFNTNKYEVEFHDFSYIISVIKNYIISSPFRALNDGERRHHREVIRRVDTFATSPTPIKKKGMFGLFGN